MTFLAHQFDYVFNIYKKISNQFYTTLSEQQILELQAQLPPTVH
jgi:hypothetical protein